MIRDEGLYIEDILESIKKIEDLLSKHSKDQFDEDWMIQDAVLWRLAIIGEASNKLSSQFRERYPEIPWREVIGLRNMAVHAYYELDLDRIWDTINRDLPKLKQALADAPELKPAA